MLINLLLVAAGGGIGAVSRYLISLWAVDRWGASFPYGTLIANISGCFIIGLFMTLALNKLDIDPRWRLLVATGFLGGLTTFSTYSLESLGLIEFGALAYGFINIFLTLVAGLAACYLGIVIARLT